MSSLRVCLLTTSYPRWKGDPSSPFVEGLCTGLVGLGVEVRVVAPWDQGASRREVLDGVEVRRVKYWPWAGGQRLAYGGGLPENLVRYRMARVQAPVLCATLLAGALGWAEESDIVHAHWPLAGLSAVLLSYLRRVPQVTTLHGAGLYTGRYRRLVSFVLKHSDFLIYNSSYTAEKCFVRKPPHRERIIPPGIDLERFTRPVRTGEARSILNLPESARIVFSLGRMVQRKGFPYLIRALENLDPRVMLILGGTGPMSEELRETAGSLGLDDRVLFPGRIPDDRLPLYYRAADVFVLPAIVDSRGDTEGLGMVLVEAMASGLPVVGTRVGGIPDVVEDGVSGYLVEQRSERAISDAVSEILESPGRAIEMGEAGRKTAGRRFSWRTNAERTLEVYRELKGESL